MSDDFVNLHTHTDHSAFDGFGKIARFAERVAEMGQPALALTEHGSMRSALEAQQACDDVGVKFIPGVEAYVCDDVGQKGLTAAEKAAVKAEFGADAREEIKRRQAERRDRDHITLWAMNDEGLRNLYRLTSEAWTTGFYGKPRIDINRLAAHANGVMASTGCPGGIIPSKLRTGDMKSAISRMDRLADLFGDRLYVEVMPHVVDENPSVQRQLLRLANRYGIVPMATQDAHYPCRSDAMSQEVLLAIQTRDRLDNPDRFHFPEYDYWLRTRTEMVDAYAKTLPFFGRDLVEAMCDATVAFADRCSARVRTEKPGEYLVAPTIPPDEDSYESWLISLCQQGCQTRYGRPLEGLPVEYQERLLRELETIFNLGFASYFIMVWDVRKEAVRRQIVCGPGRGSAAGSLVSYLLSITDLDPIKHGLMFERFLAPGRKDLPDIDLDFEGARRGEIVDYLRGLYGEDRVAHISTSVNLGGRAVLRDVAKAHGVPEREYAEVSSLIVEAISEEDRAAGSLTSALEASSLGRSFAERYPDVVEHALALEGQMRHVGIHAAGVIVSSVPLADIVPLETRAGKGSGERTVVVAYDMYGVEKAGLVKLDILGLTTLSVIAKAQRTSGLEFDFTFEDPEVYAAYTAQAFGGVFQYDSPSSRRLCRDFEFRKFSDIAVMTALNRPGPMKTGIADQFIARAMGRVEVTPVHPVYDAICAETHGVLVYQEQVVQLARDLAGYSPEEADAFRKRVAKKLGLSQEEMHFIQGAEARGMSHEDASRLFGQIRGFAEYAFNKSHAYAYAAVSYWTMWLKIKAPADFYAAILSESDRSDMALRVAAEAVREGIPLQPPNVNSSKSTFSVDARDKARPVIVGGLGDVKGIGQSTAEAIAALAPFSSLGDFASRVLGAGIRFHVGMFEALAKVGAFRDFCSNTKLLVDDARQIWPLLKDGGDFEFDPSSAPDYDPMTKSLIVSELYPLYRDLSGRGVFDELYDAIVKMALQSVLLPSEMWVLEDYDRGALVFAQANNLKKYADSDGRKSVRVSMMSPDGTETVARADQDVLDRCATALDSEGECILAMVYARRGRGGKTYYDIEGAWLARDIVQGDRLDPVLAALLLPEKTKPKNPMRALLSADQHGHFVVEGTVVRVQHRLDKNGAPMAVCGLAGSEGYIRFFIFSRAIMEMPQAVQELRPGRAVRVKLQRLDGEGACLSSRGAVVQAL